MKYPISIYRQTDIRPICGSAKNSPGFNGKEKDYESGYLYYGARYYESELLTGWLGVDPMMDKYPSISPYAYCAWNPVKLVDSDGREMNPIYDLDGNFLGVDQLGLRGSPIIMERHDFSPGMSHHNALKNEASFSQLVYFCNSNGFYKFINHSDNLKNRPDWDGIVTRKEGILWAKKHPNALKHPNPDNTLYINTNLLDFGNINTTDFANGVGCSSPINTLNFGNLLRGLSGGAVQNTVYALGRVDVNLVHSSGVVSIVNNEATNYDWNKGGGFIRQTLISAERIIQGLNETHGFKTFYYGFGIVKQ